MIEDDVATRKLLSKVLRKLGFSSIECSNGQEGLNKLEHLNDIDFIVTDLQLPSVSGLDLIKQVRADSRYDKVPILIVSGVYSVDDIKELLRLPEIAFTKKPISFEKIKENVCRFFSEAKYVLETPPTSEED